MGLRDLALIAGINAVEQDTGLPFFMTCLGPRTECAGFTSMTWPTTSQSNSIRSPARCCFTHFSGRTHFHGT